MSTMAVRTEARSVRTGLRLAGGRMPVWLASRTLVVPRFTKLRKTWDQGGWRVAGLLNFADRLGLQRRLPLDGNMLVAGRGLDQMTTGREGEVITGHQHAVGCGTVENPFARRHGFGAVYVEGRLPIRMPSEHRRMLGGVTQHQKRLIAGLNGENGMPRRVAWRRQRDDAGRDFLARLKLSHLLGDVGKNTPLIEEGDLQVGRRAVQIGVVHPIGPFRRRHHELGVGKYQRVVFVLDAVDVIGMEMRNDDLVDGFRIDAGRGEVVAQYSGG